MKGEKIKIVIADNNAKLRSNICDFLERSPNIIIVGEAGNGQEALSLMKRLKPDILILDIHMPILDGLATIKMLRRQSSNVAVIVLTGIDDPYIVAETIAFGAHSYILKEDAPAHIISAVHNAFRGEDGYISTQAAKSLNSYNTVRSL